MRRAFLFVQCYIFCGEREVTTARHSLTSVDKEIKKNLFRLDLIDIDSPERIIIILMNDDLLSCPAKGSRSSLDKSIHSGRLDLVLGAAGKPEELPGEFGSSLYRYFNAFQVFVIGMFWAGVYAYQGYPSLNAHEQVVKIMGDATGQGSNCFHLLRMAELSCEFFLLIIGADLIRNVATDPHNEGWSSFGVPEHRASIVQCYIRSVLSLQPVFE